MALSTKEMSITRRMGEIVGRKRRAAGFTQEQVASHLGVSSEAVSRIERGVTPPDIFKLYELAELFKCGVESFLIEGSERTTDQAEYIRQLASALPPRDRQFVISLLENLALKLEG